MTRVFRNIRQKLASENLPTGQAGKVMAYLRYVVGDSVWGNVNNKPIGQQSLFSNKSNRK